MGLPHDKEDIASKVTIRSYHDADHTIVSQLFCNSQNLSESIRSKIKSPATWTLWIVLYSILLMMMPKVINCSALIKHLLVIFTSVTIGITLILAGSRIETQNRVDEALANDLKDPEIYYLNHTLVDRKKVKKEQQQPSHFWVLTIDDEVCGMIGLSCNAEDVEDQRETLPVGWKQFCAACLELYRLPVPGFLKKGKPCINDYNDKKRIFAHLQIPKTATITRWIVRSDLQARGLSTMLINQAIVWAGDHGINRVYAMTNECCTTAEQILTKRHGFVLMKKYSLNFFGENNKLFACRVKEWIEKNGKAN